ncbi:hypothetical protein ACQWF5_25205, partial [Salmonella enterica subsp. enterica serovar Infantis]
MQAVAATTSRLEAKNDIMDNGNSEKTQSRNNACDTLCMHLMVTAITTARQQYAICEKRRQDY